MLRTLLRWSVTLNIDSEQRAAWEAFLSKLAPLPTGEVGGKTVWLEANSTQAVFLSNAAAYSIVYYAALYPAQVVSLSSDTGVLETAWNTVEAVNAVRSALFLSHCARVYTCKFGWHMAVSQHYCQHLACTHDE
jgi:hypothetical protein